MNDRFDELARGVAPVASFELMENRAEETMTAKAVGMKHNHPATEVKSERSSK